MANDRSLDYFYWFMIVCCMPCVYLGLFNHPFARFKVKKRAWKHRRAAPPQASSTKRRRRALTNPSYRDEAPGKSLIEGKAGFSSLPYELRLIVYNYIFTTSDIITLEFLPDQWRHRLRAARESLEGRMKISVADKLSFLMTSRQIYTECIAMFYATPTFNITHPYCLPALKNQIPPHRFSRISSLTLTWTWTHASVHSPLFTDRSRRNIGLEPFDEETLVNFWGIVADEMVGLKKLTLKISRAWADLFEIGQLWVQPILKVRNIARFEVVVVSAYRPQDLAEARWMASAFERDVGTILGQPRQR